MVKNIDLHDDESSNDEQQYIYTCKFSLDGKFIGRKIIIYL